MSEGSSGVSLGTTTTWANYMLVAAAVAYLYDFILTVPTEIELYNQFRWKRNRRLFLQFLPLRYLSLVYQIVVLSGLARSDLTAKVSYALYPTPSLALTNHQRCGVLDNLTLSIDSAFQFAYVAVLCWRIQIMVFDNWFLTSALAALGFAAPLINVIVPNPSIFPECRMLYSSPPSEIILLLPCLRSAFDALVTGSLLIKFRRHLTASNKYGGTATRLLSKVIYEEIHDLIMIFGIMTMEAVFVQMPSVRIHGRNYIAPFVDSITASLATRFIMGIIERSQVEAETYSLSTSRRTSVDSSFTITSFQSPHPATFRTNPQESINENNAVNYTGSALPPSRASLDSNLSDTPSLPPSIMTSPASWQEADAINGMNNIVSGPRGLEP
ncbi:hypothetical protein C8R46DRAFT_480312 [Mycena filopes]|nr:hypothetical protein C8R46DRAFT_480312 [Mycena filopes]